jgi:preprotein translocase subunit SecE
VARDRQRAKQRKQQRRDAQNPGPPPTEPHRDNIPGELDHVSGGVDQFEAALVAGAGGEPVVDDDQIALDHELEDRETDLQRDPVTASGEGEADLAPGLPAPADATSTPTKGQRGSRFVNFLRASWAELQRVQWPDRRQVGQATAVVLGFVVIAGAYLGLADAVAQKLVDLIL